MTDTVKSAVMTAPNQIKQTERDIQPPGPGEVELKVGYVGICGSDLHAYQGGSSMFDFPVVFGHEFSAQVVRCGANVDHLQEGQWVGVAPLLTCGDCSFCRTGNDHLCEHRVIFGAVTDGALRERLTLPSKVAYHLPASVSPPEGALGEPLAVAVHAVNRFGRGLEGANTIVSGAGAIGMLIALVLAHRGANQIMLLEVDDERRLFAQSLGFQVARPEETPASTADCLFIATGATEAMTAIPELLAPLGVAVVVGILPNAHINWLDLLLKEGSVTTSRYFTFQDYQEAIRLLSMPGFKAKSLVQAQLTFEDLFVDEGQKVMNRAQQVMRLLIKM
jgi:2-desacetyl-2-hydroxyethyl bacteriochlorophyllide A dehydrogenase